MVFDRDFLERITSLIDIVDLIGEHVQLKKAGANYKGLCPFHQEKTPSFMVNRSKGIFHCFGCGKGGDSFRFLMEHDGLSFAESVRQLAQRAGIPLPKGGDSSQTNEIREQIFEVNRQAAQFYRDSLFERAGEHVRRYLSNRQISGQMITEFDIGYAPDGWRRLSDALKQTGISLSVLSAAGLIIVHDDGHYDRFRDRVIIPIRDAYHRICGFGGRILGQGEPKYLNSPETEVFKKSRLLFGLHRARESIRQRRTAVIVEGYFDVIMMHQVGVTNVVAPLGTSLTSEHIGLVHRFADEVVLLFDGDAAGRRAARRSIELLFENGRYNARVGLLAQGEDPDDTARKGGTEAVQRIIDSSVTAIEFLLSDTSAKYDCHTPEGKVKTLDELLPVIAQLPNELTRTTLAVHVASRLGVKEELVIRALRKRGPDRSKSVPLQQAGANSFGEQSQRGVEDQFMWVLLNSPELISDAFERVNPSDFQTPALREIALAIQSSMFLGSEFDIAELKLRLATEEAKSELDRLRFPMWRGWEIDAIHRESMIQGCVGRLQQWRHRQEQSDLHRKLVAREATTDINSILIAKRESKLAQLSYLKMIAASPPQAPVAPTEFIINPEQVEDDTSQVDETVDKTPSSFTSSDDQDQAENTEPVLDDDGSDEEDY